MVNAINQIAHTMDLLTIAEFVENQRVLDDLRRMKIDYAQGYHICKPFSIMELGNDSHWSADQHKNADSPSLHGI
jgi:EAL domain-containing protein (putative c-di-GMP-specific phosphodiesterase class I)